MIEKVNPLQELWVDIKGYENEKISKANKWKIPWNKNIRKVVV